MIGAEVGARRSIPEGEGDDPSPINPHATITPRDGLPCRDLGHGTVASAITLKRGDRLGMAAQAGDVIKVKKMLKSGVDPNFQNAVSGITPLGVAAERGHLEVARLLLDARASPSVPTNDDEAVTPLHTACQFGHIEVGAAEFEPATPGLRVTL